MAPADHRADETSPMTVEQQRLADGHHSMAGDLIALTCVQDTDSDLHTALDDMYREIMRGRGPLIPAP
jgi:hypothetical protein